LKLKTIVEGNAVVPVIVVANKADLEYSVTEEEIRTALEIGPGTPVYFISATDPRQCRDIIDSMVDQITRFEY
jgi:signal recognition particle receptor subunit beta